MKTFKELKKEFKEFVETLTPDDINLYDKLNNMCGCELTDEEYEFFADRCEEIKGNVFCYIKEHLDEYENAIVEETIQIKDGWNCTEDYDLGAGFYNMDMLYISALQSLNMLKIEYVEEMQ